jgi:hypothetical protein
MLSVQSFSLAKDISHSASPGNQQLRESAELRDWSMSVLMTHNCLITSTLSNPKAEATCLSSRSCTRASAVSAAPGWQASVPIAEFPGPSHLASMGRNHPGGSFSRATDLQFRLPTEKLAVQDRRACCESFSEPSAEKTS